MRVKLLVCSEPLKTCIGPNDIPPGRTPSICTRPECVTYTGQDILLGCELFMSAGGRGQEDIKQITIEPYLCDEIDIMLFSLHIIICMSCSVAYPQINTFSGFPVRFCSPLLNIL